MKVSAKGISKKYYRPSKNKSHFEALKNIDIDLNEGEFIKLSGRSGSGKSTLLYILSALLFPNSGNVFFDDKDIYSLNDEKLSRFRNQNIGIIPQGQTGLQALTVLQNILLPTSLFESSEKYEDYAKELMEKLEILHLASAKINELSGGEIRRMAIARSLIMNPKIIFADEPTDDLDSKNAETVLNIFKEKSKNGTTIFLVTHDNIVKKFADTSYIMEAGTLMLEN